MGGWIHFGIAAAILAASAVGFQYLVSVKEWATQKQAIPWPKGIVIDPQTFRWRNMPTDFAGRYVLAEDGELFGTTDGQADGEIILKDDVMDTLGIGTSWDQERLDEGSSNWYVVRIYRDTTKPPGDPFRYWALQVFYYTGALDTVPHVPERCLEAGGASLVSSQEVTIAVPHAVKPWDELLTVRRTLYEVKGELGEIPRLAAQYYIFSLNGLPETSWKTVRLTLAAPWVRYCYFAKIQFYPRMNLYRQVRQTSVEEIDAAAREFVSYFLPEVLRALPMPDDIDALKSLGKPTIDQDSN